MGPFETIVAIVGIGSVCGVLTAFAKSLGSRQAAEQNARAARLQAQLTETLADFDARLAKLEKRMGNIETIVIDRDKQAPYDAMLRDQ